MTGGAIINAVRGAVRDQYRSFHHHAPAILQPSDSDGDKQSNDGGGGGGGGSSSDNARREYYITVSAGSASLSSRENSTTYGGFLAVLDHGPSIYSSSSSGSGGSGGGIGDGIGEISDITDNFHNNDNNVLFNFNNDIASVNDSGGYIGDINSFSEQLFSQIEFKMGDELTRYVCPAIIVLGNICNIIAFLVLRRKKFKSSSVAFYLRAYAVANLCFLDIMLGLAWLCLVLEISYVATRTDWSCRLWTFIANVITYSGIWFVVVMGIDRLVHVYLPSKAPSYCTVFSAKAIVTFVLVCLVVVSIHAMWTFELQPQGCWVSHHQDDLHTLTWPWWSATLYSYIPLLLLLVQIIAQVVLFSMRRIRKHSPTPNAHQAGDQDGFVLPVFVITTAFFFFTVPSTVINLLDIHLPSYLLKVDVIAKIELTKKITELLSSFNNAIMGLILLICSSDYRAELMCLFRSLLCCVRSRTFKVFEMRTISNSDDSSPHIQVDYELCNNNEDNMATADV